MNRKWPGGDASAGWHRHVLRLVHHHWHHDRRLLWSVCTVAAVAAAIAIVPAHADNGNGTAVPTHGARSGDLVRIPLAIPVAAPRLEAPPAPQARWTTVVVEPGQTLSQIFDALGFGYASLDRFITKPETAKAMRRLHPGDELGFLLAPDGSLQAMRYDRDDLKRVMLRLNADDSVSERVVARDIERHVHVAEGTINSSLFAAADDAGMDAAMVIQLADVFKFDIDFIKDIRKGDHFSVIYDDVWSDGQRLSPGRIIAAEFFNRGERFTAFRFVKPNGDVAWYTEDGRPLRKALLRTPVKFSRISSRFSRARQHPILGYTRAHEGVDYAAPRGTPIHAAGNGVIKVRGWVHGYGRYIRIRDSAKFSTVYAHMSRFAPGLHVGSHVRQGQVIGYVGMSGLATGPHLHYEVRIHGNPVNPLTVTLPKPEPLPRKLLARFQTSIAPRLAQLERLDLNRDALLASRAAIQASSPAGSD